MIRHGRVHFIRTAKIKLVGVELHPRGVVDGLTGVDAQQDVVCRRVFTRQVMSVAGCHHWQSHAAGDVEGSDGAFLLNPDTIVLDFDVKILCAEDPLIPGAEALCLGRPVMKDVIGEFGRGAARQADEPVGMPLEDLLVDAWLVVKAFQK